MGRLQEPAATRLFGRGPDLERVEDALEQARLVTLTGTAGVGKTRLAKELARRRAEPLVFVDVTEARGAEALCRALAHALGVAHRGPPEPSIEALGEALAVRGKTLVILDNFEHNVDIAGATVGPWIDAAADATFIVTSRERLHLEAEVACDLSPLATPPAGCSGEETLRCDAVQLFLSRARAARGGGAPSIGDPETIAEIVRRLDGVPLAIELAAARADVLAPAQILSRLSRPLDLLATPSRGGPSRGTTLRVAIACSWDLLADEERRALSECAVFRGGFTLEAAEEIVGVRGPVVDVIQALVRKSLLYPTVGSSPSTPVRLAMFESVRAFVLEVAPPPAEAQDRHAAYYLRIGEVADKRIRAAQTPAPLSTLLAEHDNLLAVLERAEGAALARGGGEIGVAGELAVVAARALTTLGAWAWLGGSAEPWIARLDALLAALRAGGAETSLRARVVLLRARAAEQLGRIDVARADAAAALAMAEESGSRAIESAALLQVAVLEQMEGRSARALLERARDLAAAEGEHALRAAIEGRAGWARFLANPMAADEAFEGVGAGLRSARVIGDGASEARHRAWLGVLHACLGRFGAGRSELETGLQIARGISDRGLQLECLAQAGVLALDAGDLPGARAAHDAAAGLLSERVAPIDRGVVLALRARIALVSGQLDAAEAAARAALDDLRATTQGAAVRCLLAGVLADRDDVQGAEAELALVDPAGSEVIGPALALAKAHVVLARSRAAEARGDLRAAEAERAALAARLREARPWSAPPAPPELRLAARWLLRRAEDTPPARGALLLGPDAAWFHATGADPVDLEKRKALRRILAHLATERVARPGSAVDMDALLRAGWPGTRLTHDSAKNRVHVAISTLRKLGLRRVLLSLDDGWLLDPSIAVVHRQGTARREVSA